MILQALTRYYETLAQQDKVARAGWGTAKVSFALTIGREGDLLDVMPLKVSVPRGKKTVEIPRVMRVPEQIKKSVNIASNFLCEGTGYLLGIDGKGKPERSRKCFDACRQLHLRLLQDVDVPAAKAVCAFFEKWDPQQAQAHPALHDSIEILLKESPNLVFRFEGGFVQDIPEVARAWDERGRAGDRQAGQGVCLVTGRRAPIARLHPAIKGVRGAQSTGASLVSFNARAFESYGKDGGQGLNAPVGERAAFAYGAALNYLVADDGHRKWMGDATVVYWAENAEPGYQDFFSLAVDPSQGEKTDFTEDDLMAAMRELAKGRPYDLSGITLRPETDFYILGVSPNAGRLSVRFFYHNTFGGFMQNLDAHYRRLEIVRPKFERFACLSIGNLLFETVNKNAKDKSASPLLAGALMRAVLNDTRYPAALLDGVMVRIRADRNVNRARAAILKAVLLKKYENTPFAPIKEGLTVELNDQTAYLPYVLGRIFYVLENIQTSAIPGLNATIQDRYFTAACATPASIFPQLLRLKGSHMKALKRDKPGLAFNLEKELGGLMDRVHQTLPRHLTLEDQGVFILGYYHERQASFAGKPGSEKKSDTKTEG